MGGGGILLGLNQFDQKLECFRQRNQSPHKEPGIGPVSLKMCSLSSARTALYILMVTVAPQAASAFIEGGVWQVISAGAGQTSAPLMHLLAL
jgi:hypothetical protein